MPHSACQTESRPAANEQLTRPHNASLDSDKMARDEPEAPNERSSALKCSRIRGKRFLRAEDLNVGSVWRKFLVLLNFCGGYC